MGPRATPEVARFSSCRIGQQISTRPDAVVVRVVFEQMRGALAAIGGNARPDMAVIVPTGRTPDCAFEKEES
jgi:hypothetical protein